MILLFACATEPELVCEELTQDGSPSGIEYCSGRGGELNRVEAVACTSDPRENVGACDQSDEGSACSEDGDCGEGSICGRDDWDGIGCECFRVCETDADCEPDEACVCAASAGDVSTRVWNTCLPADCRTGADCESGTCGVSLDLCGWAAAALACRSDADECAAVGDCEDADLCILADGAWSCEEQATCD
ncbi:MAG: hypothetical protein ACOZNI_23610 [Myxococcota bacterium]